ncbi:YhgE/Pip domain-containing protein [Cytobacillus sp. FSL W8-0315]|uniref:YhgE/Pip domain-containing protein n=1 Tax=Cytobacillus TaxID=2675230 RepID=UPI00203FBB54|nr:MULTISPECIES: YhgE/Pip domain-containing protein [Cytobacillus]MBY0156754.1 YhgE/Pip domain-containing protein [Cytobacillus firmus]MCM3391363.1 YhgE/Pip domain-containing protein [Cytobacillus oceanisediminis]UQX52958.1 YhgE/Pip domain-containing protein [Cytobacillus pseudoceanisediminis]
MWKIYKMDIRSIFTNWVAAVLIGGLTLLPSLYAWFNIEASWDPYSQTDQLPVGIVNEDAGAVVRDKDIHIGDDIVKELKKNDDMDWHFDNRKDAMDKVEYGDYFAVIVIPDNFSQKLGTVIENQPEKAKIEYYVNEKINAIAPKITEKGAGGIVDTVTSNFISTVNGTIFEKFNELGLEIEKDLPDIKRFEEYVFQMEEKLPEIHSLLSSSLSDAENAQKMIDKAQALVPDAKRATGNGLQTINETMKFINEAENRLNAMEPQIQENLEKVQNMAVKVNDFISSVQSSDLNLNQGKEIGNQINEQIAGSLQNIETIETALKQLQESNKEQGTSQNQEQINQALEQIALLKQELQTIQENGQKINAFLSDKQKEADDLITRLQENSAVTAGRIDAFVKEYNENIRPAIKQEVASAKETLSNARNILTEIQSAMPEIEKILANTEGNLGEGEKTLKHIIGEFPYISEKINQLADRIRDIKGETDINEIIELLQNDPEAEKGFFEEPVQLNKNSLFPIQNYGTGMTPFYTVLAIWVGALLLISLLATDVHHHEEFTGKQIYFGKLLTFLSIGFAQTLVVTIGNILILGVDAAEPVWFILFGLISSLVFILIVYTLVSVFGDVGKAMAIVLLVLQIAGAGGTYPTALLPEFFQTIHPFLPFSYAIDLMREAVGGIVWERVYRDLLVLTLFGFIALLIGTFLKEPLSRKTKALMKKSKESGLFH